VDLEFVPLLQVQRDLYVLPRGMERFREYLRTMTDAESGDLVLPLVAMNPMGKDHVPALLDEFLSLGADDVGAAATADAGAALREEPGRFKVGLVISDDLKGGWTQRHASELGHRIGDVALYKRGWITGILWTSEPVSVKVVREAVMAAVHRAAHVLQHGPPRTLGQILAQEGAVMASAGCDEPRLDADDLAYTREVIEPLRDATDRATIMACLFGDAVADAFGYRRHGLSPRAGFALALHQARQ
jgi:hypothetical protein